MNIRKIANPAIQIVNPNILIVWMKSIGYLNNDDATRTPQFEEIVLEAQVQALSAEDLRHESQLNIEGICRTIRIYGNMQGVVRPDVKGGDILKFPEVSTDTVVQFWKITKVMETWDNWCTVVATLLNPDTIFT